MPDSSGGLWIGGGAHWGTNEEPDPVAVSPAEALRPPGMDDGKTEREDSDFQHTSLIGVTPLTFSF
jgi:hypothetical protein